MERQAENIHASPCAAAQASGLATGRTAETEPFTNGTVLAGRYVIEEPIGSGGFGRTYRARDKRFVTLPGLRARKYVIKQLVRAAPIDEAERRRFFEQLEREAAVLIDLNSPGHPNIPDIYEYLPDEGCLVMKYVEGRTLGAILRSRPERPIAERKALRYTRDVCKALVYMHQRRDEAGRPAPIIHRDVKPKNIIRDSLGRIWLIDFGLAQLYAPLSEDQRRDTSGTDGFAPPEQRAGRSEPRSDIYALGATLHTLVTGAPPHDDDPASHGQPPPLFRPSKEVARIVARATAAASTERPDALGLLADLENALTRLGARRQRRRGIYAVLALLAVWLSGFLPHPNLVWDNFREDSTPAQGIVAFGEPVSGPLNRYVAVDEWHFAGQPQESVAINVRSPGGEHLSAISLIDPDGEDMTARGCVVRSARLACTLEEPGDHAVRVRADALAGGYNLLLDRLGADEAPPPETLDWSFEGRADDQVTATCGAGDGNEADAPEVVLRSSGGEVLQGVGGSYTLPIDDIYTLSVRDRDDTPDSCSLRISSASVRLPPLEAHGQLTYDQPIGRWTFLGRPGQQVVIAARGDKQRDGTWSDPILTLYDPSGQLVEENDDHAEVYGAALEAGLGDLDAQIITTLERNGIYTVAVRDYNGAPGSYHLSIR